MDDYRPDTLLTQREVMKLTGFKSRTSLYRRTRNGSMPPPLQIGLGQIRWRQIDIIDWINSLPTCGACSRRPVKQCSRLPE